MEERRRSTRVSFAEPVILVSARGDFVGELRDLSSRGMFVELGHAAEPVGARLVVRVRPSSPRSALDLAGVVRWRNERGLGLELDPSPEQAHGLETLLAAARPR